VNKDTEQKIVLCVKALIEGTRLRQERRDHAAAIRKQLAESTRRMASISH
jgi:hypothetical protein